MKKYLLILGALFVAFACDPEEQPATPDKGKTEPSEAPKVVSTTPAANAAGVELTLQEIVVTYDKVISLAPNPTIKLNDVYVDEDIYVVEQSLYIPVELKGGTQYTVRVISPSVKDADGNYAQDLVFSFTTASLNNFNAAAFELDAAPADASATAETKALYGQMKGNFGSATYTAAMAEVSWNTTNAEAIKATTGSYPAINAFDYVNLASSPASWIDYGDITPVKDWAEKGGIVAAGWHWKVPVLDPASIPEPEPNPDFPNDMVEDFEDVTIAAWDKWALVDGSFFKKATPGARLYIYYTDAHTESGNGPQMALKYNLTDWPAIVSEEGVFYGYFNVKEGEGFYSIVLDATELEILGGSGLVISGRYLTLKAVGINHAVSQEFNEIPLDFDDIECGSWAKYKYLDPASLEPLTENSQIVIYFKDANGAQMGLRENSDGWPNLADSYGSDYSYFNIPDGEGHFTVYVDEMVLNSCRNYGILIAGHDYTITSVTFRIPKETGTKAIIRKGAEDGLSFSSEGNGFTPAEALKDGTWQNEAMKADLAKLAGYLKLLQDEGIPVLFRPLHEASGGWFWWGSGNAADFKALWQYVFNYMGEAGVHNLIWVWSSCLDDADWYPGDAYVDIIAYDWYPQNAAVYHASGKDAWDALLSISNKKMLTLAECSAIPSPENCAQDGSMWLWAMPWYGDYMAAPYNDAAFLSKWMGSQWVITLPRQ